MKKPVYIFNYTVQNNADSVDIYIDGTIVDASTQKFLKEYFGDDTSVSYKSFRETVNKTIVPTYNIYLNGPGGHVGDALAIHDFLINLQAQGKTVNTIGRGIVASSLTLILLAGNNPVMSSNSWFMMHTVSGGIYGTVKEVENYAVTMRKFNSAIRDLYVKKSGLPESEIDALMEAETWLSASEAEIKNFVKVDTNTAEFSNYISPEIWPYSNISVLNQYNSFTKQPNNIDDMKKFFTDLTTAIINGIKGVKPEETDGKLDATALVNSIAVATGKSFENVHEAMETAIKDLMSKTVSDAVTTAIQPFENRIATLETANTELEAELLNLTGGKTGGKTPIPAKTIGNFNEN